MADIDVGHACADMPHPSSANYTYIANENPANDTGTIDYICAYVDGAGTFQFGTMTLVSGTTYNTNGESGALTVAAGLNEFNAPGDFTAFAVTSGDYAAVYCGADKIKTRNYGTPTGSGLKRLYGDKIGLNGQDFGADLNAYDMALRFTGATAGGNVDVSATTDALTLTEYSATVNAETSLTTTTDTLALTEQTADISLDIDISADLDILAITEHSAIVNAEISISAGVDALVLTEQNALVSIGDDVLVEAGVDNLLLTEHIANVNAEISFTANIDSLTLVTLEADVNISINIPATVDVLTLVEYNAVVNAEIMLAAGVDNLILSEYIANISIGTYNRRGQSNFGFSLRNGWR